MTVKKAQGVQNNAGRSAEKGKIADVKIGLVSPARTYEGVAVAGRGEVGWGGVGQAGRWEGRVVLAGLGT